MDNNFLIEEDLSIISLNEFTSDEKFSVFFRAISKFLKKILKIIIELIGYITKNIYNYLSNIIDRFNMLTKYIKPKYLKDPSITNIKFDGKDINDINAYQDSLKKKFINYNELFKKIQKTKDENELKIFINNDYNNLKSSINDNFKEKFENSNISILLDSKNFTDNLFNLKETRKELSSLRVDLITNKLDITEQLKNIERQEASITSDFLRQKRTLMATISDALTNISKERTSLLNYKITYLKEQNYLIGNLYTITK